MGMEILKPGPLTTVQDEGRFGYMKYGIGSSGVMDRKAYKAANELVGNSGGEAVLEATLLGPDIRFNEEAIIAVTGADMNPDIDGENIELYKSVRVHRGQTLHMAMAVKGCRSYIAVRGGIDVEKVMGSRSTNLKCRIGGYQGRKLEKGDILTIGITDDLDDHEIEMLNHKKISAEEFEPEITVRVIEGPQDNYFTEKGLESFYNTGYRVSAESDRMGIRLDGAVVESKNGTDIVSDGITFGSIQVPSSGKPIILMADHQTTGGYAKIATVVSEDLSLLAQARPGDTVKFKKTTIEYMQHRRSKWGRIFKWI